MDRFTYKYYYQANGQLMASYNSELYNGTERTTTLEEQYIYGSNRIGTLKANKGVYFNGTLQPAMIDIQSNKIGKKRYELTNHLGNVLATISDRKIYNSTDGYYEPVITMKADYYAFGMLIPNRHTPVDDTRHLFNGMEHDQEVYSSGGSSYDYGARMYNSRLGRWFSRDPLEDKYPDLSPYSSVSNNPIIYIDKNGEDIFYFMVNEETGELEIQKVDISDLSSIQDEAMKDFFVGLNSSRKGRKLLKKYNKSKYTVFVGYDNDEGPIGEAGLTTEIIFDDGEYTPEEHSNLEKEGNTMKLVKFLNEHNDDFTSKRQWVLELNRIYKSDYDNQFYRIKGVSPLLKPYSFDGAMTILHEFHHLYFESYWEEHIEMGEISDNERTYLEEDGKMHKAYKDLVEGYKELAKNASSEKERDNFLDLSRKVQERIDNNLVTKKKFRSKARELKKQIRKHKKKEKSKSRPRIDF